VLICLGPGIARRIRTFPANWRGLADAELMDLCNGRWPEAAAGRVRL